MKTVRLRGWTEGDVNLALAQLSKMIQTLEVRPEQIDLVLGEDFARHMTEILDQINALEVDVNNRVLKGIRINNIALITDDIEITSDMIPFELNGVVYNETITERLSQVLGPVNIRGNVQLIGDLPLTGNLPRDGMVVLRDETNDNNQWLYMWVDKDSPGVFSWHAITPFGVDLTNFYTKDETWSSKEIIADQLRQDNAIRAFIAENDTVILNAASVNAASLITSNNIAINNQISDARRVAMQYTDTREAVMRAALVPNTRRINDHPLTGDITLSTLDIRHNDQSLYRVLLALRAIMSVAGIVDNYSQLPTPVNSGEAWVVRNGISPGVPDLYVIISGQFVRVASFNLNLDNYYTIPEVDQLLSNQAAQLAADIVSSAQNTLTAANNFTDSSLQAILGLLNNKVGQDFPIPLLTGLQVTTNDSNSQRITLLRTFLNQDSAPDLNILLPGVTVSDPGLMSPSILQRHNQMSDWIESFVGGLFVGSFSTRAALSAAPISPDWNDNDWATVQEDETYLDQFGNPQLTKYIFNRTTGWRFSNIQGGNMPGLASNTRPGLTQGNPVGAGNISVDANDGRMSVNGWAELINRIGNSEATVGLNSQGQPTTIPTGMRLDIQNLQDNKVDNINRTPENNLVTVNVNSQGQVTGGATTQASNTISDFASAVDARVNAILATALGVNGIITVAIRNAINTALLTVTELPALTTAPMLRLDRNVTMGTVIGNMSLRDLFRPTVHEVSWGIIPPLSIDVRNTFANVSFGIIVASGPGSSPIIFPEGNWTATTYQIVDGRRITFCRRDL